MKKTLYFLFLTLWAAFSIFACSQKDKVVPDTTPRLVSIVPYTYISGGTAIISGSNFSENISDNIVLIDGLQATVTEATKKRLTIILPDHANGKVEVKVTVGGVTSPDVLTFTYATLPPDTNPVINSIVPNKGIVGSEVTINGKNFSAVLSENSVLFGSSRATLVSATATKLVVIAPNHNPGAVTVSVTSNRKTGGAVNGFTYEDNANVSITSISPTSGEVGDIVRITGEGFIASASANLVTMGDVTAEIVAATTTTLDIIVPDQPGGTYQFGVQVGSHNAFSENFALAKSWRVETVAGNGTAGTANKKGTEATVNIPQDCVVDGDGLLWFTQRGVFALRTMDTRTYQVRTVALKDANMGYPWGIALEGNGKVWFANKGGGDYAPKICYWDGEQVVPETGLDAAVQASKNPMCVEFGADGTLYVLCRANPSIIYQYKNGSVQGQFEVPGSIEHMTLNPEKTHLFLGSGSGSNYLRTLDLSNGNLKTIAGSGDVPTAETYSDGTSGNPLTVPIGLTEGMCVTADGTLFFTDVTSKTFRSLTPGADGDYAAGTVKTLVGTPFNNTHADGLGKRAGLVYPCGIVELSDGSIILLDGTGHRIRRIFFK